MLLDVRFEATVAAPPGAVFDYLADGRRLPDWMTEVASVRQASAGPPAHGTRYTAELHRGWSSGFEWSEFAPPSRLAWLAQPISAGAGSVRPDGLFELEPAGAGTLVAVALRPELGGLLAIMGPVIEHKIRERGTGMMARLVEVLDGRAAAATA